MLALWRKEGGEYNGPATLREHMPWLFDYMPRPRVQAQVGLLTVLFFAWRQFWAMRGFKFQIDTAETPETLAWRDKGDCTQWSRALRDALADLVPPGSLRLLYCTTGQQPGDWNQSHMTLALVTLRGVYVIDNLNPRWRPFNAGEHHDWNME